MVPQAGEKEFAFVSNLKVKEDAVENVLLMHISYDITNKMRRVRLHCGPPLQTPSLGWALLMSKFGWSSSCECLI